MSEIQPEFGALFGPKTKRRAGENIFAFDSALLGSLRFPSVKLIRRNLVTSEEGLEFESPLPAEQSVLSGMGRDQFWRPM
jgi:hypothetical protein